MLAAKPSTNLGCVPDVVQCRVQPFRLSKEFVPRVHLLIEDIRLVAVNDDAAFWCIVRQKVLQPHFRFCGLAEPTSVWVAVETVDGNDAMS